MESGLERLPILKDHFALADIVALAEFRHGVHGKAVCNFLQQYAGILKGLLFELPIEYQTDIDEFMHTAVVNANLQRMFQGAAEEGKPGIVTDTPLILRKARDLGIPVICFDATKRRRAGLRQADQSDGYYFVQGECRDEDMANKLLSVYRADPGKYAVLIGADHLLARTHNGLHAAFGERMRNQDEVAFSAVRLVQDEEPLPPDFPADTFCDTIIG